MQSRFMRFNVREKHGIGLLFAVLAALILLGAATIVATHVVSAKQGTDFSLSQVTLDEAAKAGLDAGIERFWNQYFTQLGAGTQASLSNYRGWLNTVVANNANGLAAPVAVPGLAVPITMPTGSATVQSVTIDRVDDGTGSTLTFRSLARVGNNQRAASQTVRIAGAQFQGFEFAVLANNINCILCHANIRNADLEWNSDASKHPLGDLNNNGKADYLDNFGTYDRVKVAALQSLGIRPSEADSNVAGTVYTGGSLYDQYGNALSGLSSTTFNGWGFSSGNSNDTLNGKVSQDSSGNMASVDLVGATTTGGKLDPWANLYMGSQTDGLVPDKFPAPYQDDGGGQSSVVASEVGNRKVDDSEFAHVMTDSHGTITGGVMYGLSSGSAYTGTTLPSTSNLANINGSFNGNLILVGTSANPIIIDGPIAVNGDLVLKGVVRGKGQLLTRKNVYVMGDVTYDDNATQGPAGAPFGVHVNADGTTTQNLLGVVAGGSVLMGDYLTVRGKNSTSNTSKYPDIAFSIDVRTKNKSGTMNGQTMNYGYFDPGVIDAGKYDPNMTLADGSTATRQGQQTSFTSAELMLFNKLELDSVLAKRLAGENVTARLYGLRESQPGDLYTYDYTDEHAVRYDEGGNGARVKRLTDWVNALTPSNSSYSSGEITILKDVLTKATTHFMNPSGNWMSEAALRQAWYDDEMSRTSTRPFRFDGLIYSNNAVFAITKSMARHKSNQNGQMVMRGAMIAPDLGVLVPNGLELLYDKRVKDLLNIADNSQVQLTRRIFRYVGPATVAAGG